MATRNTQDVTSAEDAVVTPEADAAPARTYIKYTGTADVRRITAADWKSIDVPDQGLTVWDKGNRHRVPLEKLNDAARDYLLNEDGAFEQIDA